MMGVPATRKPTAAGMVKKSTRRIPIVRVCLNWSGRRNATSDEMVGRTAKLKAATAIPMGNCVKVVAQLIQLMAPGPREALKFRSTI